MAGLYAEDEVVAIDGVRGDAAALVSRSDERSPGDSLRISVFRRDQLLDVPVVVAARPEDAVWLAPVPSPSEEQRRAFERWARGPLETSA